MGGVNGKGRFRKKKEKKKKYFFLVGREMCTVDGFFFVEKKKYAIDGT